VPLSHRKDGFTIRKIRSILLVLEGLAALTVAAMPALAAGPVVIERNTPVHREITDFITCGSVTLDYVLDVKRTITESYDSDGNLVRWDLHARHFATLTDPVSGLVIHDDGARRVTDDYVAGTTTGIGGVHHLTWPGAGIVFGVAGREVLDWNRTPPEENEDDDVRVFQAGLNTNVELICSILD
jgi:hypothetical protein